MYAFLTDVLVFPHVAEDHVASQQHSYTADVSLLHINVLVVVSIMTWKRDRQENKNIKPQLKKVMSLIKIKSLNDLNSNATCTDFYNI